MKMALRLARQGLGRTSPNPMVGAVVVKNGVVVGRGYHQKAGGPHAERIALTKAGKLAKGATLYLNLEPCNHTGRTPPCTRFILEKGIKKVVFGMKDPNPRVKGGGAAFLRSRGLEVVQGVLEEECRQLNQVFIKWIENGLPYVTLKAAASLDGRIATRSGDSKWISNEKSRLRVHQLRNQVDGVLVGIGTVLKDDPRLTVRLPRKRSNQPIRIVVDPELQMPAKARMFSEPGKIILVAGNTVPREKKKAFQSLGVGILSLPVLKGRFSMRALLKALGKMEITSLLVEGGAEVFGSFVSEKCFDKLVLFFAPILIGGHQAKGIIEGPGFFSIDKALQLREVELRRLNGDILVEAYPEK